jgi:hypothetical protein
MDLEYRVFGKRPVGLNTMMFQTVDTNMERTAILVFRRVVVGGMKGEVEERKWCGFECIPMFFR